MIMTLHRRAWTQVGSGRSLKRLKRSCRRWQLEFCYWINEESRPLGMRQITLQPPSKPVLKIWMLYNRRRKRTSVLLISTALHEKMKSFPEISTQLKIFVKMAKLLKLIVALMSLQKSIQIISRSKLLEDLASFKITSVLNPSFVPPVPI